MNRDEARMLLENVENWNGYRAQNPTWIPNLSGVDFSGKDLSGANLDGALLQESTFRHARLVDATFRGAFLTDADLSHAQLNRANLYYGRLLGANLQSACLDSAKLVGATLDEAKLIGTSMNGADLTASHMRGAQLVDAKLKNATMFSASLTMSDLSGTDFSGAKLGAATLVQCVIERSIFDGAFVYGIAAWDLVGTPSSSENLVISPHASVTVDDLEMAQFVYLLLHNEKLRHMLDTIGEKAVLILGRFTQRRKAVLDIIREKLRKIGYAPILFDFDRPAARDLTETIRTLTGLCRFVIADITNPRSSPLELQATIPDFMIPFVPIIEEGEQPFAMFADLANRDWVLDVLEYRDGAQLIEVFEKAIVQPALEKADELLVAKTNSIRTRHAKDYLRRGIT